MPNVICRTVPKRFAHHYAKKDDEDAGGLTDGGIGDSSSDECTEEEVLPVNGEENVVKVTEADGAQKCQDGQQLEDARGVEDPEDPVEPVVHSPVEQSDLVAQLFGDSDEDDEVFEGFSDVDSEDSEEDEIDMKSYIVGDELVTKETKKKSNEKVALPKFIQLTNLKPGEPAFMRLRTPLVLRFHKINRSKDPHGYIFSQLQLYMPFRKEEDLGAEDYTTCQVVYARVQDDLRTVKTLLFPHMDGMLEASERVEELFETNAGAHFDPANEQDNDDCEEEGVCDHPNYLVKDPSDFADARESSNADALYNRVELYDEARIAQLTLRLDDEQRRVLDTAVNYAKAVKKSQCAKVKVSLPIAPLLVVQGGAGSGKSALIEALTQRVEGILRTAGDHPDHPYIVKAAFTGTAASNIEGQTLNSAFNFPFGNHCYSLGDKTRDHKRTLLQNLLLLLIDEFSMMKADMLYQLDFRLRELKQKPDVAFGGVAVLLFGDIMQLRPVLAKYIFEEPLGHKFKLPFLVDSLWEKFDVMLLVENHRQNEDKPYAELLNRIRVGKATKEDEALLRTRVKEHNHPDLPPHALRVMLVNANVNAFNDRRLAELPGREYVNDGIAFSKTQVHANTTLDKTGSINGTQLQRCLKFKIGANVMLTTNVNVKDFLTNGTFGKVVDVEEKVQQGGNTKIVTVLVEFLKEKSGKDLRRRRADLQQKYPGRAVTPITLYEQEFSLGGPQKTGSMTATAVQFPLKLAFAATAHKVQGMTVEKPDCLIVDFSSRCQAAQGYVMISRVQQLQQLFIVGNFAMSKFYPAPQALKELERMESICLNNKLKSPLLSSVNVRSLRLHFPDMKSNPDIKKCEVICLQETWLHVAEHTTSCMEMDGFTAHFNSAGRGKGVATYYREAFTFAVDVCEPTYQMTKIQSPQLSIINVYRSSNGGITFMRDLCRIIDCDQLTYIVGDMNICYISQKDNRVVKDLKEMGFTQLVKHPSHMEGGLLDHFYSNGLSDHIWIQQQSPYFSDHDILLVMLTA